jgi:transmembrane sensor
MLEAMRRVALEARPEPVARRLAPWLAVAACVVLAIGGAGLMGRRILAPSPVIQQLASEPGELRTVVLSDGTRLTLGGRTLASAEIGADRRRVRLERGQIYLEVRHDARRPFDVVAGGVTVTDLGTTFDVLTGGGGARIVLVEGAVEVRADGVQATLSPGQVAQVSGRSLQVSRVQDVRRLVAWRDGYLDLRGETLGRAVEEMNRYSAKTIIVRDAALRSLPITGRYKANDADGFAMAVADLYGLRLQRLNGGEILLSRHRP